MVPGSGGHCLGGAPGPLDLTHGRGLEGAQVGEGLLRPCPPINERPLTREDETGDPGCRGPPPPPPHPPPGSLWELVSSLLPLRRPLMGRERGRRRGESKEEKGEV